MHAPEPPAVEDAPEKGLWSIIDRKNTFGCLQYAASALVIVFLLLLVLRRETIGFSLFVGVTFAVLVAGCHCLGVPLSPKKAQAQRARNGALQAPKRAQEVAELAERERLRVEDERRADDERIGKAKARAKAAEAERRRRAAAAVPQAFTPSGFEHEVAALLRRDGWKIIRDGGGPNDGRIDVLASRDGHKLGVQCKFYGPQTPLTSGRFRSIWERPAWSIGSTRCSSSRPVRSRRLHGRWPPPRTSRLRSSAVRSWRRGAQVEPGTFRAAGL